MVENSMNILPDNTREPMQQDARNNYIDRGQQYQPGSISSEVAAAQRQSKETGVIPEFEIKMIKNNYKSEKEGRPIFDEVEWITIRVAGDRNNVVSSKVRDEHRQRFPHHYAVFKSGEQVANSGTPLEEWPVITRSMAANLKALNITTVEELAGLSDQGIINIGHGGRDLVNQAKAFIEMAKEGADPQHYAAENQRLNDEISRLKNQINEISEKMADYANLKQQVVELNDTITSLEGEKAQLHAQLAVMDSQEKKKPGRKKSAKH